VVYQFQILEYSLKKLNVGSFLGKNIYETPTVYAFLFIILCHMEPLVICLIPGDDSLSKKAVVELFLLLFLVKAMKRTQ